MAGCLKYELGILMFSSQLNFQAEFLLLAFGLLNLISKMVRSILNNLGILNFSLQLKFHEECVFKVPGLLNLIP